MKLLRKLSIFIWFSFLYRTVTSTVSTGAGYNGLPREKDQYNVKLDKTTGLAPEQRQELYKELQALGSNQRQVLFDDLVRQQQEFELSKNKWNRLRDAQQAADDLDPASQSEVDQVRDSIKNGSIPVVRNKRTLKFLVSSLAEILGLRWTLLKYSWALPLVVNGIIGQPNASAAPPASAVPPAAPGKPAPPPPRPRGPPPPPPRRLPPPRKPVPPPPAAPPKPAAPAPPQAPPGPPTKPGAPPPASTPPPTIPPNQIDPNTIRYPFRPAPTIPFLVFAPLPAGVTVPYPPLFQWPSTAAPAPGAPGPPATAGAKPALPPQPPCAAPPPVTRPKPVPRPPSILPLPKPRPLVPPKLPPPPPKKGPSKTPLKLEYDHPVRIEIFNNVKPHLPASGTVYGGDPAYDDKTEKLESPTQAVIQAINDQYNTENYNNDPKENSRDYDYGFFTGHLNNEVKTTPYNDNEKGTEPSWSNSNSDYNDGNNGHNRDYDDTTPAQIKDYFDSDNLENEAERNHPSSDYYGNKESSRDYEETTKYNRFVSNVFHDDYPEQAEENRANIRIRAKQSRRLRGEDSKTSAKRIKRPKKVEYGRSIVGLPSSTSIPQGLLHVRSTSAPWKGTSMFSDNNHLNFSRHKKSRDGTIAANNQISITTEFPLNHAKTYQKVTFRKKPSSGLDNRSTRPTPKPWYEKYRKEYNPRPSSSQNLIEIKKPVEFRIIVPNPLKRKKRDLFFDEAFKNFNHSAFDSFEKGAKSSPIIEPSFIEIDGKLIPDEEYRKKLEVDLEHYVEKYVEEQITKGKVDIKKPKTTIIELKPKHGPPIKTVTTTVSKLIDGNQPLTDSILEFSKHVNPVSNIADLGAELGNGEVAEQSEFSKAFESRPTAVGTGFDEPTSWSFFN